MIETSCDLYITIQSEDLFDVVKKYSIKKKGDGNIVYYPDSNAFCFLVEYFNQANLYDAVPAYEWDLTSNILKWINAIIADIPSKSTAEFTNCINKANYAGITGVYILIHHIIRVVLSSIIMTILNIQFG